VFQHRRPRPEGDRSAIRHHLDKLVPLLGDLPASRPPSLGTDPQRVRDALARCGLEERAFTLVHPGSTWPEKAWPEERWPALMQSLDRDRFADLAVVSPPGDRPLGERVASAGGGRLLPALAIPELSAVLSRARAYVGNDGGVLHMAVAHRIPTVGLFGPTEPDIWFPYEDFGPYRVLHGCDPEAPEGQSQLGPIAVPDVRTALEDVLRGAEDGGSR
jgi:ADP-heptose:LPS heptosyltransferase